MALKGCFCQKKAGQGMNNRMETVEVYSHRFKVRSFEVGPEEILRPWSLLHRLQETAIHGSASRGYDMERYRSLGTAWVLRQWRLQVSHLPEEGRPLVMRTWISGFRGSRSHREFLLEQEDGEIWGRAQAEWVYMDRVRRRPVRVDDALKEGFRGSQGAPVLKADDARWLEQHELLDAEAGDESTGERVVRHSDLDSWDHANQAVYVRWALDRSDGRFRGFRGCHVRYLRETRLGDRIRVRDMRWQESDDGEYRRTGAQIERWNDEGQWDVCVLVAMAWADS
jgi:acyl-ACP thioesterase